MTGGHLQRRVSSPLLLGLALLALPASAQPVTIDAATRHQPIDGFGTFAGPEAVTAWWQQLFLEDLGASIMRLDLTPPFLAPVSTQHSCSPWFGQAAPLTLDGSGNGPDGTRTRQYTSAADYSATFGGCSAPIAVLGTDLDASAALLDLGPTGPLGAAGALAQAGQARSPDFKLYGSVWSPAPWLKVSSGNTYGGGAWPLPAAGVHWPFIWAGNFAGGRLDVSGAPLAQLGNTSALTQFARTLAAFLHGFQQRYGVRFHAISIQNELNFEEYYNSATYPRAAMYVAALKAARAELDAHPDLAAIRILGPEDLLGGDAYSLWELGAGSASVHKNLQYLQAVAADPAAAAALAGFAVHGYGPDGVSAAGASSVQWERWATGWTASPAEGLPDAVAGFLASGKRSWMTETSGETSGWLDSSHGAGGFPDQGGFSIAVKLHQALTAGMESAWLYWQLTDGSPSAPSTQALTDATSREAAPKYNAAKHFFRWIRPGARRVSAVSGAATLLASGYLQEAAARLTVVLVNETASTATVQLTVLGGPPGLGALTAFTSSEGAYWQASSVPVADGGATVPVPAFGVVTLTGTGTLPPGDAGVPDGGPGDGGAPDGGGPVGPGAVGSCGCTAGGALGPALVAVALLLRRRRLAP